MPYGTDQTTVLRRSDLVGACSAGRPGEGALRRVVEDLAAAPTRSAS